MIRKLASYLGFEKPTGEKDSNALSELGENPINVYMHEIGVDTSKPDGLAKQILNQLPNNFILNLTSKEKILMKKILLEEIK